MRDHQSLNLLLNPDQKIPAAVLMASQRMSFQTAVYDYDPRNPALIFVCSLSIHEGSWGSIQLCDVNVGMTLPATFQEILFNLVSSSQSVRNYSGMSWGGKQAVKGARNCHEWDADAVTHNHCGGRRIGQLVTPLTQFVIVKGLIRGIIARGITDESKTNRELV
ncbi:hypothetical protein FF38_06631 [Lucilia cuprina]|uniref:Uncharacterized protein n=1 Tax=Lucilia cuprina TaxID=7375 RepID=A0A0L0CR52_LUCCU|nr:hypothetical protein FF38_06631 [Lucilia cuprina]